VKLWPRHITSIHDQITSNVTRGVQALATLVIADLKDPSWKDSYEQKCLTGKVEGTPTWKPLEIPLEGYFEARSGGRIVEHFLLRLPTRA
jgi:hypothetical protein